MHCVVPGRGPKLTGVELSFCEDDFINVHSRVQVVGHRAPATLSGVGTEGTRTEKLILLDPRLSRDVGLPNDAPYGTAETLPYLKPGDNMAFYALNSLVPLATRTWQAPRAFSD